MSKHRSQQLAIQADNAMRNGRKGDAERLYRELLATDPAHADGANMLAVLCAQRGAYDEAELWLAGAVGLVPDSPIYRNNLGEVQRLRGRLVPAIANFEAALGLAANYVDAHFNLGLALKSGGDLDVAVRHWQMAVRLDPNHQKAWLQLGNIQLETWNMAAAIDAYLTLLALNPNHVDGHHNLGIALLRAGRYAQAAEHLEQAVALNPKMVSAHHLLGLARQELGQVAAAQAAFEVELTDDPDNLALELHVEALGVPIPAGNQAIDVYVSQLHATLDAYRDEISGHPEHVSHLSWDQLINANAKPPFYLSYYGREMKSLLEKWAAIFVPRFEEGNIDASRRADAMSGKNGALHIGYVVTHGHAGVFVKDRMSLLNRLSAKRFRFSIFCNPDSEAMIREAVTSRAIEVVVCTPMPDAMADQIGRSNCQILCYWEIGSDTLNYFLAFLRLAPVQCLDWGTPYTSGIPTVDYYISSALMEPEDADTHYSEKLIQIPDIHTYHPRPQPPDNLLCRQDFDLDTESHMYLCAQNPLKIHPDFDELVARILQRDPKGVVLLINKAQHQMDQLRARMEERIPQQVDRIITRQAPSAQDYFSLLALADVALDTLHYSGMNITYDTLVVGTPVVTCPGEWMRSRYTYAIYRKLGLMDCVATDWADYVDIAVRLGTDPAWRSQVNRALLAQVDMLFENPAIVDEFSRVFEQMWQDWQQSHS